MNDDIKLIRQLGFSEYQSKALLALLKKGEATASQISNISGVPHTKIYAVLKSINGYLLESPEGTRPRTFRAIDVESIVNRVVSKRERYVDELKSRRKEVIARLEEIHLSGKMYETEENLVWFVSGLESALGEIARLAQSAQDSLYTISTPSDWVAGHSKKEILISWIEAVVGKSKKTVKSWEIQPQMTPQEYEAVDGAMKAWIAKLNSMQIQAFRDRVIEYFSKDTLRIREIPRENAHFTMVIKDDDTAFIGLRHPYSDSSESGIIVNDKRVVKGLQEYFRMNLWTNAISVKSKIRKAWLRAILGGTEIPV